MRTLPSPALLVACLLLAWGLAAAADNPNALTDQDRKAGFELLFNGADLQGWEHKGNWKVEDGTITRTGKGSAARRGRVGSATATSVTRRSPCRARCGRH